MVSGGATARRDGQQERGRGVVREILCLHKRERKAWLCAEDTKNDSVTHVGGPLRAKQLVSFNSKQTNHTA